MDKKINPNLLGGREYIEEVSENFEKYITGWISDYKNGILSKEDVIKVTEKVAKFRKDDSLVEMIKQRMG